MQTYPLPKIQSLVAVLIAFSLGILSAYLLVVREKSSWILGFLIGAVALVLIWRLLRYKRVDLLLFAITLLCAVPVARVDTQVLQGTLSELPNDSLVRNAFELLPGTDSATPEIALVLMLGVLWIVNRRRIVEECAGEWLVCGPLIAFAAVGILNIVIARSSGLTLLAWAREFLPIGTLAAVTLPLIALFKSQFQKAKEMTGLLLGLIVFLGLHSSYAELRSGLGERLTEITPYNNFPFFGLFCTAALPFILYSIGKKRLLVFAWLISFVLLLLTQTRAALLACVLVLPLQLVLLFFAREHHASFRARAAVAMLGISFAAGVAMLQFGSGVMDRITTIQEDDSARWRPIEIEAAMQKVDRNMFFGEGLGSSFSLPGVDYWNYIHNSLFYYLADMGILGVAAWMAIWIGLSLLIFTRLKSVSPESLPYFVGASGGIFMLLIYSLLQSSYRTYQNSLFLGVGIAIVCAASHTSQQQDRR